MRTPSPLTQESQLKLAKTPDALVHLPAHAREEYRRLKEEIATREKKKLHKNTTNNKTKSMFSYTLHGASPSRIFRQ